jgi:hypothetical protein
MAPSGSGNRLVDFREPMSIEQPVSLIGSRLSVGLSTLGTVHRYRAA